MVNRENQSLSKNDITNNSNNNINIVIDSGDSSSTLPNNNDPIIVIEAPQSEKSKDTDECAWR